MSSAISRFAALMPAILVPATEAAACRLPAMDGDAMSIEGKAFRAALRPDPQPIVTGAPFALEIAVCAVSDADRIERIGVDATMPAHRHGMNYAPSVSLKGEGRYRAEGLMLHMPGLWQFAIEIRSRGTTHLLTRDIVVP